MKFMKRFIVLVLGSILIVGGAGILFASGGNESPGAKGTVAGNWGNINWQQFKGKQLNVLATAMPVSETYKKHLPEFEQLTGIKVNFELLNDVDRYKKMLVDLSSGKGEYDIGNIGFTNREAFAGPGYLEPLESYLGDQKLTDKAWYNLADYPKDVIAAGYSNGKLVFVPFTAEYFLFWYRKDIFKDLNLTVPKTFEELTATAQKLDDARKAGKIKEYAWAERELPGFSEAGWNLFCTASRFNFSFIDYNTMVSNVNTARGKEVLDYYTSMILKYAPPGTGNWSWGEIAQAFKTEQVAMATGGNASYATLENAAESKVAGKVGYAPPPMAPGGSDPLWVWGWGINKDSHNKGAAWLFVQWATSPTLMKSMAPGYGCPARQSSYSDPDYVKAMPSQEFIDAQLYMLTKGINPSPPMVSGKYNESADIVSKEMSNIIAGIKDVKTAAADADGALMKLGYKPAQ